MGLYWKDIEIIPGMTLAVDFLHNETFNKDGYAVSVMWKIISFNSRSGDEAYIDYISGKKYPLKRVIKKKRLQTKLERKDLLQIPACSDFMIVQEYHDGEEAFKRCYNLDMLQTIRNIRVIDLKS